MSQKHLTFGRSGRRLSYFFQLSSLVAAAGLMPHLAQAGPGPNSETIPSTGQDLSIVLSSPADGSVIDIPPGSTTVEGSCSVGSVPGDPICVVYVVDVSGSTDGNDGVDTNGDGVIDADDNLNAPSGDTEAGEILDGEIAGVISLHNSLGDDPNVYMGIVAFASGAAVVDVGHQAGMQYFVSPPQLDGNGADGVDIEEVLRTLRSGEGGGGSVGKFTAITSSVLGNRTDFKDALGAMNDAFANCPASGQNIAFFLSDGVSNDGRCVSGDCTGEIADAVAAGTVVNTIGIGPAADGADLGFIADSTGGSYTAVTNPSDLSSELPSIDPAGIDRVEVDGVEVSVDALGNFSTTVNCNGAGPLDVLATCFGDDVDVTEVSADLSLTCVESCPLIGGQADCSHPACDGASCDDGNACTQTDSCSAGVCQGVDPVVCSDPGECQSASCNPSTGLCDAVNDPNGTVCSDAEECGQPDTCNDGVCEAGPSLPDGTTCNADGDLCTVGDACEAGTCQPGPALSCGSDSCLACNPGTGSCDIPLPDGETCEANSDACSLEECSAGSCVPTGETLPSDQCADGLPIFGCRLVDGVDYIRPAAAKPTVLATRTPGQPFFKWRMRGEILTPNLPDATFDPDSQISQVILSQDSVIYPPGNPDDQGPLTAPTLLANLSDPCDRKMGFCEKGRPARPKWQFKLSNRDDDVDGAVGWRLGRFVSTRAGSGGIETNRKKFTLKGLGGPQGIVVDPEFLKDENGFARMRQTLRVGNVCYTSVLSCLQPPDKNAMKCFSRQ